MRGIVAELNGKYAIILARDGSFRKIKATAHMAAGSEIDLNQPTGNTKAARLMTKVASIAAAALFVLGIGYGAYSYTLPYSYVDVDINPSIELTVNVYDRIIKAEALNNDGKKVLGNSSLKNTRLEAGVSQLLNIAVEQGYLKARTVTPDVEKNNTADDSQAGSGTTATSEEGVIIENAVLFTVSSEDAVKSGKLKKGLTGAASKELEKGGVDSELLVGEASIEQRNDARKFGVTPGKLALIEDAMEAEPELKLEELKKTPVKDLIKKAKDKKDEEDKQKAAKDKAAKDKGEDNSTGKSGLGAIDRNNESAPDNQGVKQEQTINREQPGDLGRDNENVRNDENDGQDLKDSSDAGKNDNGNNNGISKNNSDAGKGNSSDNAGKGENDYSNSNSGKSDYSNSGMSNDSNSGKSDYSNSGMSNDSNKDRKDTEDDLEREKQQREQLKDELLEQVHDNRYKLDGKQGEKGQQTDENEKNIEQSKNNGSTQKDKKDKRDSSRNNSNNR